MEQTVRVRKCNGDGTAQVVVIRESACSGDCHKCSGCGAAKQAMLLDAHNPIGAAPGDTVRIESESGPVLTGVAVFYVLPLVLFFLGYALGELWGLGLWFAVAGFVGAFGLAIAYDRLVAQKQKLVYTIVGYAHQ